MEERSMRRKVKSQLKNEEDKELATISNLEQMLRALAKPIRWEIFRLLRDCEEPMSFTQIKQYIMKEQNKEYYDGQLWNHLQVLINSGLLKEEKKIMTNKNTGRTITSFYRATEVGVMVVDYLKMLHEKISELSKEKQALHTSQLF
jgi:methylthioribose-1-phosphate isomerase